MRRRNLLMPLLVLALPLMGTWPDQGPAPVRTECVYTTTDNVSTGCVHNTIISNRGAGVAIVLSLPVLAVGMEACAVNDAGESMTLEPNGTDRFLSPATDTNGDYLLSTVEGDTVCFVVMQANEARVISNTGGWNEE